MRRCSGNDTREWGFDSIFEVECDLCGRPVEIFKDEISRICPGCRNRVKNDRGVQGCGQWCSSSSTHQRNRCPKFKRSKDRFVGHKIA